MPIESKYLTFIHIRNSPSNKTKIIHVFNKTNEIFLGVVSWFAAWRKYCFEPESEMVFDSNCLQDIKDFLDKENKQHKEERL